MEQVIERLLREEFDYERGSLDFSCPRLELTIEKGETAEGSFTVYGLPGKLTKGRITTSDMRMECLTPEFCGNEEQIQYCFHSEGMEEGDVVKGEFQSGRILPAVCGHGSLPRIGIFPRRNQEPVPFCQSGKDGYGGGAEAFLLPLF